MNLLTSPLSPQLELLWQQRRSLFLERHPQAESWLSSLQDDVTSQLKCSWSCSDSLFDSALQHPDIFQQLLSSGDLFLSYQQGDLEKRLRHQLAGVEDEQMLHRQLRRFRRREMTRIVWRDLNKTASLTETTTDMTALAEATIQQALRVLYPIACQQWGTPIGQLSGLPQPLLVIGMGKLGAWELNVSSDIDLIFTYPEAGETRGGRRAFSNHEFFIRLGQKLIAAIDTQTVDGFVFRVDMRLRPYGDSGALALNFDALQEYYLTQGREWERYAMIKARVVAGEVGYAAQLMEMLRPFTYRKYIDYSAIDALRDLKLKINAEVKRKGLTNDVKRGAGGIREIEFIAQTFQLIRGGRDLRLQDTRLHAIYQQLVELGLLPEETVQQLLVAYDFLRNTEHIIQGINDQQTQQLPADEQGQLRVAYLMGFDSFSGFEQALQQHRNRVRRVFNELIEPEQAVNKKAISGQQRDAELLWLDRSDLTILQQQLEELGFKDAPSVAQSLWTMKQGRDVANLQPIARKRLDTLMPLLISCCAEQSQDGTVLLRALTVIESILRRSAYIALLVENPSALQQLVRLVAGSAWITEQISRFPALLDELLDPRTLFTPPDKTKLQDELRQQTLRLSVDDVEEQLELLRYFRRSHALRVAACEITDVLPLMKVSDYLTWLAETILQYVIDLAWRQMQVRHGDPSGDDGRLPAFIVVGYGKLGGIELGHGSDLDLVFIHNAPSNRLSTGERPIDNSLWFTRLGQKIINILTVQTHTGALYDVDMRLRPSGNSGLLVTTLQAFEKYQQQEAWTWEHQALVRARVVAGSAALANQFDDLRQNILQRTRDFTALRQDVLEMREKMRRHLDKSQQNGEVDIKQGVGGIVDIEFMVQFAVLAWASKYPALTRWSDNIRILETMAQLQILPEEQAQSLIAAYKALREHTHRMQLQGKPARVDGHSLRNERQCVQQCWAQLLAPVNN